MKISVFTPTHRLTHLSDAYSSIKRQSGEHSWEWVIIPNNGPSKDDLPTAILADENVKVCSADLTGIGALKNFACSECSGDVLVELDHDDVLTENAFDEIAAAHEKEPNGFYYSDFVSVKTNGKSEVYAPWHGWETYPTNVRGDRYIAMRAFAPSARSICQIYYAPNHVRAWSRSAYDASGGHDKALPVADDHDLVCKTYLTGAPFVWIDKPIYVYRRHNENSFVAFRQNIKELQNMNTHKYLYKLILEECRRSGNLVVDLGHSFKSLPLWESFDALESPAFPKLPFEDNSVGIIRLHDVLHRVEPSKLAAFMSEEYRALVPGGWVLTSTPAISDAQGRSGRGAFQDPAARSYWSENNFYYLTKRKYAKLLKNYSGRFQAVRLFTEYPNDEYKRMFMPYVYCDLSALKGQRQPGIQEI